MLAVDIVSRNAARKLEVYSEHFYLEWDGSPYGLKKYNIKEKRNEVIELYQHVDKQEGYSSNIVENMYSNEIDAFFNFIEKNEKPAYSLEDDFDSIDIDIENLGLRKENIYYVACPLRYNNVIQYFKENIDFSKVFFSKSDMLELPTRMAEWR